MMVTKSDMPHNIRPMLAAQVDEPFDDPEWLFEIKWDGYRAISEVENGQVRLYSRNFQPLNELFPIVVHSLEQLGCDAVLDGEVVVVDESGVSSFQMLQNYRQSREGQLVYYVFDLLYLGGRDLRSLPLIRRKEILEEIIPDLPVIRFSDHVEEEGMALFRMACSRGLEGIIAKKADSPYRAGTRSRDWLKVKSHLHQNAVIGGFTEPRGGRKHIGALVLGVYEGDELNYIGHSAGRLNETDLAELRMRLDPLVRPVCPFGKPPVTNAPVHWVEPILVCEVQFTGWTEDGILRHPVFIRMVDGVSPLSVRREAPALLEGVPAGPIENLSDAKNASISVEGRILQLTNLNKVYWPEEGYTKGDLLDYYQRVASYILPHLIGRPQSLHRHPNGIHGDSFFQKDVDEYQVPEWLERVKVRSESGDKDIDYAVCNDLPSLLYLANLGCIELNPWLSRRDSLYSPDYLVIDLDPLNTGFDAVVEAALVVHGILESAGIPNFCKTSGATGLHIYVPLGARYSFTQARQFAEIIANFAHRQLPKTTSIERNPEKRVGKVYLDYLQNRRGQTLAAPYCIRPLPGAPVSTPLHWDEVKQVLDAREFNIRSIPPRLEKIGDIFLPVLTTETDLYGALGRLAA